jgi:hypothetical protein
MVIRPLAVRLGLGSLAVSAGHWRGLVRFSGHGVASLYCLALAVNHGLSAQFARQLGGIAVVAVAGSIIVGVIWALPLRRETPGTVDL